MTKVVFVSEEFGPPLGQGMCAFMLLAYRLRATVAAGYT